MSDRTDERVTTIRFALGVDDIEPREYEDACEALASLAADAAETQTLREALSAAKQKHASLRDEIDSGDDFGEHFGIVRHNRAIYQGQAEILALFSGEEEE